MSSYGFVTDQRCDRCDRIPWTTQTWKLLVRLRAARDADFNLSRYGHHALDDLDFALDTLRQGHNNPSASGYTDYATGTKGHGGLHPSQEEYLRALVPDDDYPRRKGPPPTGFQLRGEEGSQEEIKIRSTFQIDSRVDVVYFKHHPSLAALESAAAMGCYLCRSLWVFLWPQNSTECFPWEQPPRGNDFASLSVHRCRGNMAGTASLKSYEGPIERLMEREWAPFTKSIRRETLDRDLECLVRDFIRPCIDGCDTGNKLHQNCRHVEKNSPDLLPTRLVDVGAFSTDKIRLVVTRNIPKSPDKPKYLTLSYCWGGSNDSAKTTLQNFEERQRNIDTASLPRTIQDAIRLTRAMRIRYLWVDALCIIQNLEDFYQEAVQMGSYYANGYCLISATGFSDSSEGLFPDRRAGKFPTKSCPVGYDNQKDIYLLLETLHEDAETETVHLQMPVMKRAWCLQERLLSPRVLHITATELFWRCRSVPEISESYVKRNAKWSSGYDILTNLKSRLATPYDEIFDQPSATRMWLAWTTLVHGYLDMDLSEEDDRLTAIQGLGDRLAKLHKDEYFCGIFISHLAHGLLWRGPKRPPGQRSTRCPTWSWGVAKWIEFTYLERSLISNIEGDSIFPLSTSMVEMMGQKNRSLHLKVPLVPMADFTLNCPLAVQTSVIWKYRAVEFVLYFDEKSLVPHDLRQVEVILLGYTRGCESLAGLVVRNSMENYEYVERIGYAEVKVMNSGTMGTAWKLDELFKSWEKNVNLF